MTNLAEQYSQQGFAVVDAAVGPEDIASIRAAADRIIDGFDIDQHRTVFSTRDRDSGRDKYFMDSAENIHCFLEEDALDDAGQLIFPRHRAINKIGHAMHDLDPAFNAFCRLPVFGRVLREIGYRDPVLWQTMYIFKQPGIGGEVRWHQDASYLHSDPSSVVGLWVALEDADRDNGCLWVQPGGHLSPLREIYQVEDGEESGTLTTLDDTPWPNDSDSIAVEVPAGSLVIFNDHMPHYSSTNRSERSRHAFTMHFAEHKTDWSPRNWLQRRRLPPFRV